MDERSNLEPLNASDRTALAHLAELMTRPPQSPNTPERRPGIREMEAMAEQFIEYHPAAPDYPMLSVETVCLTGHTQDITPSYFASANAIQVTEKHQLTACLLRVIRGATTTAAIYRLEIRRFKAVNRQEQRT